MPKQERRFTPERAAQGFRSQAELDAFYRYYDHTQTCVACQQPGPPAWVDDGWQPTRTQCPEGLRLFALSLEDRSVVWRDRP